MPARFILSLDCEGKWGVADILGPNEHSNLSDARLRDAYANLLSLLDEFEIPGTFAFVGLFATSEGSFRAARPAIESLASRAPAYLESALDDLDHGSREGWHGAWALEAVATSRVGHEIALHGVTHVPWGSKERDFFLEEMSLLDQLEPAISRAKTFIFPRNEVAHVDVLAEAGFEGFRTARPGRSRFRSLLSEFNILTAPETDPLLQAPPSPVEIPAGYFLNWPNGLRKLVPRSVTRRRVKQMLKAGERRNATVHLWFHPENIASAPAMLTTLRAVLEDVAQARERGACEVLTQLDYCRRLRAPNY